MVDLPPGASSVPLPLADHLPSHTLSFRCVPPQPYAAAAAADALPLWSRPVTVRNGMEAQLHVVVPVIVHEEPEQEGGGEEGGSGDIAHFTANAAAAARGVAAGRPTGAPLAMAILRLSVHRRGLGAVHVVLESMQGDPPYQLENCTAFPLQYRQVG